MANDMRGEVGFEALGQSWTLKLGTGAMRSIENAAGKSISAVGDELGNETTATITLMAIVFQEALRKHHPDVTADRCDDIIDDIGLMETGRLIGLAFEASQPGKKGGDARPPKATAARTGRR